MSGAGGQARPGRLRVGEREFEQLLESAPDAMVGADETGRIVLANRQAERAFGYTRDELVGQQVELLVPARFRAAHASHRAGYFADPHPRAMGAELELFGLRKDWTEFPAEISLSSIETEAETLAITAFATSPHGGRPRTSSRTSRSRRSRRPCRSLLSTTAADSPPRRPPPAPTATCTLARHDDRARADGGGEIRIESKPGSGTRVMFAVPLDRGSAPAPRPDPVRVRSGAELGL